MAMLDLAATMGGQGIGEGWARAGRNLARSMGGSQQQIYDEAMSRRHKLEKQLSEARIARDEDIAREQTTAALTKFLGDPDLAEAASVLIRGAGGNFDQVTQGFGNLQSNKYQATAADALLGENPDLELGNRALMAAQGKPVDLTKVEGNTAYNPMVTPDAAEVMITPYGQGMVNDRAQRTANYDANSRARIDIQRQKATAGKPGADDKARKAALKEAARDAYYGMRADGVDLDGVTQGDIEFALEKNGKFVAPGGEVYTYNDPTIPVADFSGVTAKVLGSDAMMGGAAPVRPAAPATPAGGPPAPGARKAPDGNWYIPDPNRPGKYLRVDG